MRAMTYERLAGFLKNLEYIDEFLTTHAYPCWMTACFYSCLRGDGEQTLGFFNLLSDLYVLPHGNIHGIYLAFPRRKSEEKQEYLSRQRSSSKG